MVTVRIRCETTGAVLAECQYATPREALDARDRALDAGFSRVQVLGLPEVVQYAGPAPAEDGDVLEVAPGWTLADILAREG